MAKFSIECPKCGSINKASTSIFAKKIIKCGVCNADINIEKSRFTSKTCSHCSNVFVYDQANKKNNNCPACGKAVDMLTAVSGEPKFKMVQIDCPRCASHIEINAAKPVAKCPVCDHLFQTEKVVVKSELVADNKVSVIKYEGDNLTFIWKHPVEDFNHGSQLIVHESQEAIFLLNGEALDTFGPGRYTLDTQNVPGLKKAYSLPASGSTPFHCEVYFINKIVQMGIKWGTDTRVRFIDPVTGIPLDIGASGEANLMVEDGRKLLIKLVGTTSGIRRKDVVDASSDITNANHRTLQSLFRAPLMTEIKTYLASTIKDLGINILEIDSYMSQISEALRAKVSARFEEYGLTVPEFYVTAISLPEDDKNFKDIKALIAGAYIKKKAEEVSKDIAVASRERKIVEAETEAQLRMIRAQSEAEAQKSKGFAEAEIMRAKGYTGKDKIDAEVQMKYAESIGKMGSSSGGVHVGSSNNVASDMVSMMAQMKMAETMMDKMNVVDSVGEKKTESAPTVNTWTCSCGESENTKAFCMSCGKPKAELWACPECGHSGNKGNFCENCGSTKNAGTWTCTTCGATNSGKFCSECGSKKTV